MKYAHIVDQVFGRPWAITPEKFAAITEFVRFKAAGGDFTAEEIAAVIEAAAPRPQASGARGVAVIPVFGVLHQRMNLMSAMSGGTSTELLTQQFRQAMADPSVGSIVLNIESPGGGVYGIEELASEVFRARGQKRVVAVANSMAASAAYWLASAAEEIVVTPSGEVGSIGVLTAHQDNSAALEQEGVKVTLISAGKFKTEGNPLGPLTDEARAAIQGRVDEYYTAFVAAVARGRGVTPSQVRGGFGEGRMAGAKEAVRLGMADRIATLDDVIGKLMGSAGTRTAMAADTTDAVAITATWFTWSGRTEDDATAIDPPDDAAANADDLDLRRRRLRLHESAR